ncbi:MAG: DUF1929 domain-containing protein [Verrucomicrobiaceae bacterium]|nr:DUF1929 domain-containing protein [Verrucomicrobiaceae bacterium]
MNRVYRNLLLAATLLLRFPYGSAFADDTHASADELALAAAQLVSDAGIAADAPIVAAAVDPADCAGNGAWSSVINWTPHIPVSVANLPDGRLLTFASNQRTSFPAGSEFTYAATWNPATGVFQEINHTSHDMFCGGIALLADGRVMVNGGRNEVTSASVFDWRTNKWTRVQNMAGGRWYNTTVAYGQSNVFTATGSGTGNRTAERWNATAGWTNLTGIPWGSSVLDVQAGYARHWHPFLSLAPDGRILHFGPTDTMHWLTMPGTGSISDAGTTVPGAHYPKEGSFAMYDEGKILVAGGGANTTQNPSDSTTGTSTKLAYTVDMTTTPPTVAATASMANVRQFANAVVIPSGEVMVIGGNTSGLKFNDTGSVMPCEIWNPKTRAWRTVASISVPRNYHSTALLLPDGRVWSGGGGLGAANHQDAQVYTPPCLFNANGTAATRPVLSSAPTGIGPGMTFAVSGTANLVKFAFIRMASTTHAVNTDQRYLSLPVTQTSPGNYQLTAHANLNVMTPGYWMLFGIAADGVYSQAKVIQVDPALGVTITDPGAQFSTINTAASLQMQATSPAGTTKTFSATGLPDGLSIHPSTGLISGTMTRSGVFNVAVTVASSNLTATQNFSWTVLLTNTGSGTILREWWLGIPNSDLASLTNAAAYPSSPNGKDQRTSFEVPVDWADNLGQRVRGYVYPPVTGQYRFWIAGDDESRLILGTSRDPSTGAIIARVPTWSSSRQWDKFPEQQSVLINLVAGQSYYIEALMKEGGGGDNLAVAWALPGTSTPVIIAGQYLSPWVDNRAPTIANPGSRISVVGSSVNLQIQATDADNDGLTFSAAGLPAGLSINSATGRITGTSQSVGTANPTVSVTDNRSAAVSVTFSWTTNPQLDLASPAAAVPVVAGTTVAYTINSTGGVNVRYQWSWGDGTASTAWSSAAAASHSFTNPGRYEVAVTATDDTGRVVTQTLHQLVYATLTARAPVASSPIVYEDRVSGNDRLWSINHDNDSVSVFDAVTRARLAEIPVGKAPRGVAVAPDGRAWVTNVESATISIINGTSLAVVQTVTLPRGSRPYAVVFDPDGSDAWVTCEATGKLLRFAPATAAQTASLDVGLNARHLSVSADGARVLVSRFITPRLPGEETATITTSATAGAEVLSVLTASLSIEKTVILQHSERPDTQSTGRGIPNYLGPAIISPDGRTAWVPSKQDNIKRGALRDGQQLTHDQTIRSITSRIVLTSGVPAATDAVADRVDFDNAGIASNGVFDRTGGYLFVALEGSREVAVIDVWNKKEIRRFSAGRAPQGIAISPDGRTIYVQNFMDRTLTVHDVGGLLDGRDQTPALVATLNSITTERLPANVLTGKRHFYDAADERVAFQQYISCASCHNDGAQDGRVWDFTGVGEGLRNTITLRGHGGTAQGPLHWSGNFDEVQDFENQIRNLAQGTGLITTGTPHASLATPNAGRSADLDALAAYVASLSTEDDSPYRNTDGSLTTAAAAGKVVFQNMNCAQCHSGVQFTGSSLNVFQNVGTLKPTSGQRLGGALTGLDTPTLRGLWATAPYLHDGSATTLAEAVTAHNTLKPTGQDLVNLVAYLQSLDSLEASAPVLPAPQITLSSPGTTAGGYDVVVSATHSITGVVASDFVITNGVAGALTGSGATYTLRVNPTAGGVVTVMLPAGRAVNVASVGNLASNTVSTTYTPPDVTAPSVVLSTGATTVAGAYVVSVNFSEAVTDLTLSDFVIVNGVATGLSGSGAVYSVTVTPTAAGAVTVRLPAGAVKDVANNAGLASNTLGVTFVPPDVESPSVALTANVSVTEVPTLSVQASFSENVNGLTAGNFIVSNGSVIALSSAGAVHIATVQATAPGVVTVRLPAGAAADGAGNGSLVSNTLSVRYEPPSAFAAWVNFQPVGAVIPAGYVADTGALWGARSGLRYGWSSNQSASARDRNVEVDQKIDTHLTMGTAAVWEMEVPNGAYDVTVCAGDAAEASINTVRAEGLTLLNAERLGSGSLKVVTQRVNVADGRLTIDNGGAAAGLSRLHYLHVIAASAGLVQPGQHGLAADYFAGTNFDRLRFSRLDTTIDFDWATETPDARLSADGFSVRWHGWLLPKYSETYTLTATSDDGVRVLVNGAAVINQWNAHSSQQDSGSVNLTAGVPVEVTVEYFEGTGNAEIRLAWQSASQPLQIIPADRWSVQADGSSALPYPSTFAQWQAGGRVQGAGIDHDGDGSDDLMEYATGASPSCAIQVGEQLRLVTTSTGPVDAVIEVPTSITDVQYALEKTVDLEAWSPISLSPVRTELAGGVALLEWQDLQAVSGQNPSLGIVRLRVTHSSGQVAVGDPCGWQTRVLQPGVSSVGLSFLQAPIYSGRIASVSDGALLLDDAAAHHLSYDMDARYYVEVCSGAHQGQRFDVAFIGDGFIELDYNSPNSTLAALPASGLNGERICVRPHATLSRIFDKDLFTGSSSAATSDQVLFYANGGYAGYFLLKWGAAVQKPNQWTTVGSGSVTVQDARVIAPGSGLMVKIVNTAKTLVTSGYVRMNDFKVGLQAGNNLIALPWPLTASPAKARLTLADGFTGSSSQASSDRIQRWNGSGFDGYWLVNAGSYQSWVTSASGSLQNLDNADLLPVGEAVFLRTQPSSPVVWAMPKP